MKCRECEYFKIVDWPIPDLDWGTAECNKHNLSTHFIHESKLNALTCIEDASEERCKDCKHCKPCKRLNTDTHKWEWFDICTVVADEKDGWCVVVKKLLDHCELFERVKE